MAFGKLFAYQGNPRTTAILVVAKANGVELDLVESDGSKPTEEHLKANPLGKIPAFLGEDGYALSEAIAVAIYITSQNEKTTLLGKTKQDYASILRWMSFVNSEVLPPLGGWFRPLLGRDPYNKKAVEDSSKVALKAVGAIEQHLQNNTYLVGERITLADIFAASIISRGFEFFFDKQWRSQNPNTYRWFDTIVNQDIYTAVAGKQEYLEKPKLTNVAPKKAEAPKPAAPKPAPAAAPAAEDEPAPKPKHPLEALPRATVPIDEWKRQYSNLETPEALKWFWENISFEEYSLWKPKHPLEALPRATVPIDEWKRQYSNLETPEALKWFWENIPFEEYSLWKVDYKYNDELTMTFMSANLIGGFNARLEGSRKYLFGCASVYGETNASVIQGAFVIRGQEFKPVFDVAPDYESYEFTKLDPTKPEDKEFVENMWSWEKGVTVDGKEYPHAAGKVLK
ncbi:Elongation factor 1-gamma 1 like protein [Verticillium longisporum]|uniref:Elongation factor 1-gamma 1 like protein n=2 Tax=Verticillium longisporum TaxID=100787 RepID=A0A8I3AMX7_VERLO|nr:Elongation factor 1-gamma 1 like protein [Verticillium longisporum]